METRAPQIVSPAGTLDAGIYALKAGADAVYFGLSKFSARKAAQNLTMSDARRLKEFAVRHNKKIYAALNTVIAEDERPELEQTLESLALMEADAVIVQDLGLADFVRRNFPSLPLHASTQLAVHNALGLKVAGKLSFRRAVLSRELSLREIATLKGCSPEVEREVFVHGALCYGFSGLCLASAHLTGRSGNRGECAQICRSWFERDNEKGYFFSAADIEADELIFKLAELGVSALKIEGRLKSNAYVFHTAAYYRALMDGDRDKADFHRQKSALCFARPQTNGFLTPSSKKSLIRASYPSHAGILGATALSVSRGKMTVRAHTTLSARDRLFLLPSGPPDEGRTIVVSSFLKGKKRTHRIEAGETAVMDAVPGVRAGDTLMKTMAHDILLKKLSKSLFPEYKRPLPLKAEVKDGELVLETRVLEKSIAASYSAPFEKSTGDARFSDVLATLFSKSPNDELCFVMSGIASLREDLFAPPSLLKKIRNDFYRKARAAAAAEPPDLSAHRLAEYDFSLPDRSLVSYPDNFMFIKEDAAYDIEDWPLIDGRRFLCLPPVMFHAEKNVSLLTATIEAHPEEQFLVGLGNIGHLFIAEAWRRFSNVSFFIDYGLYAANVRTLLFFLRAVPRLKGAYLWLEALDEQRKSLEDRIIESTGFMPRGLRFIREKERFPMFISRICFHRALGHRCPSDCPKSFSYRLKQNKRFFDVQVSNCITYVHLAR